MPPSGSAVGAQLELEVVPGAQIWIVIVDREVRLSLRAPSTSPIREPWRANFSSACPPWQLHLARGHGPMARGGSPRPGSIPGRARATLPACAAFPRAFSLSSLNLGTHRNHSSSASDDARAPQRRAAAAGRRSLSWNDIRAAVAARRMPRKRLHRAARARGAVLA